MSKLFVLQAIWNLLYVCINGTRPKMFYCQLLYLILALFLLFIFPVQKVSFLRGWMEAEVMWEKGRILVLKLEIK